MQTPICFPQLRSSRVPDTQVYILRSRMMGLETDNKPKIMLTSCCLGIHAGIANREIEQGSGFERA